ncbi:hypothetical protein L1887_19470 [Cichorium endivia]|nr:hypothetical protein L1887_19470 [Cichorium endivia]
MTIDIPPSLCRQSRYLHFCIYRNSHNYPLLLPIHTPIPNPFSSFLNSHTHATYFHLCTLPSLLPHYSTHTSYKKHPKTHTHTHTHPTTPSTELQYQ